MTKAIMILAVFCSSIVTVTGLYIWAGKKIHTGQNFIRLFPPHAVEKSGVLDLELNSYYLAGISATKIYMANRTAPDLILVTDTSLKKKEWFRIRLDSSLSNKLKSSRLIVDSPFYYLADGIGKIIIKGRLDKADTVSFRSTAIGFLDIIPFRSGSVIVRTINTRHVSTLAKDSAGGHFFNDDLLVKQMDGVFSMDGILLYDKLTAKLIYVYYYRNQFLVADTNLIRFFTGKTIDSNTIAKISIVKMNKGITTMLGTPALFVNKYSGACGNRLFVYSALKAKNETDKVFNAASVIDVYNLQSGEYKFSVYLPDFEDSKLHSFMVNDKMLFALYSDHLVTYKLSLRYFNQDKKQYGGVAQKQSH